MAVELRGTGQTRWAAPDWIARNAVFFLGERLRQMQGGALLAERLSRGLASGEQEIALGDLLADPPQASAWATAVRLALEDVHAEGAVDWSRPACHAPFAAAFGRLPELAPPSIGRQYAAMTQAQDLLDSLVPLRYGAEFSAEDFQS